MRLEEKLPEQLQDALNKGLLDRLPITFLPFTREQLRNWDHLFPYERRSILHLFLYLASLSEGQFTALFREVVQLEEKMGVRSWQFSTNQQTIQNASLLARSPYYQDWRRAVQKVFDTADQYAEREKPGNAGGNRLILLVLPQRLPLDRSKVWQRWQGVGRPVQLDLASFSENRSPAEAILSLASVGDGRRLMDVMSSRSNGSTADTWILDAGKNLVDCALKQAPSGTSASPSMLLSHERLATVRDHFSHEINTIRKDLADADTVYERLRNTDVTSWCPPEVAAEPVIREFLRSLYLSGNGAVLFGSISPRTAFMSGGAVRGAQQAEAFHQRGRVRESRPGQPFAGR